MGSHNFKGATCGLYGEDHVSRDFPLYIFHKYHINICTGTNDKVTHGHVLTTTSYYIDLPSFRNNLNNKILIESLSSSQVLPIGK